MPKKYVVRLSPEERERLQDLVSKGKTQAYRIRHAHVLLKADAEGPAWLDRQITEAFSCNRSTVEGIRKRYVMEGLDSLYTAFSPEEARRTARRCTTRPNTEAGSTSPRSK